MGEIIIPNTFLYVLSQGEAINLIHMKPSFWSKPTSGVHCSDFSQRKKLVQVTKKWHFGVAVRIPGSKISLLSNITFNPPSAVTEKTPHQWSRLHSYRRCALQYVECYRILRRNVSILGTYCPEDSHWPLRMGLSFIHISREGINIFI